MTKKWTPDSDGKVRWCWLQHGNAALMLQEYRKDRLRILAARKAKLGVGVSICFQCKDALAIYKEVKSRGIEAKRPFVGNGMWVTSVQDPGWLQTRVRKLYRCPGRNGVFRRLKAVNPAEIAIRTAIGAEVRKSMLKAVALRCSKILRSAESCSEKPATCVISLTEMGRQEAQTVVESCRVTLCR